MWTLSIIKLCPTAGAYFKVKIFDFQFSFEVNAISLICKPALVFKIRQLITFKLTDFTEILDEQDKIVAHFDVILFMMNYAQTIWFQTMGSSCKKFLC